MRFFLFVFVKFIWVVRRKGINKIKKENEQCAECSICRKV